MKMIPVQQQAEQYYNEHWGDGTHEPEPIIQAYCQGVAAMSDKVIGLSLMLDLSTSHVSKTTRDFLENNVASLPVRWVKHGYGWIFWPTEPHKDQDWSNTPELAAINKYAYENGCILVNFDADAEEHYNFPKFEW